MKGLPQRGHIHEKAPSQPSSSHSTQHVFRCSPFRSWQGQVRKFGSCVLCSSIWTRMWGALSLSVLTALLSWSRADCGGPLAKRYPFIQKSSSNWKISKQGKTPEWLKKSYKHSLNPMIRRFPKVAELTIWHLEKFEFSKVCLKAFLALSHLATDSSSSIFTT